MAKVILDAGHGGSEAGDYYKRRNVKNDNLLLVLRIGQLLEGMGIEVTYTRTIDVYLPLQERALLANRIGGDLLVSLLRINDAGGAAKLDFYIGEKDALGDKAARNIGKQLYERGYEHYEVIVHNDNPLIKDTDMSAVILGLGYLNEETGERKHDHYLGNIAEGIATGIDQTLAASERNRKESDNQRSGYLYRVGMGPYTNYIAAMEQQLFLCGYGYESEIELSGNRYYVYTQAFESLDLAGTIEYQLRRQGKYTFLVQE